MIGRKVSMNAEEFYQKVIAAPDLEAALESAVDSGTLADFLKANGCTATADEFSACVAQHQA
ncbi:MAG: hypothetical protein II187_04970 [Treponema sp.]|jgi:hypothetical protein|nr:hypothetical protein [Treponema sp.]